MNRFSLRIGNIEIRQCADNSHYDYEVVKWSPNSLYGKKDEYREVNPLGEVVYKKNGCTYSESCFGHPEVCYVVSFLSWDTHESCWEVKEVGTRPFCLEDEDYNNWSKLMRLILTSDLLPVPNEKDN